MITSSFLMIGLLTGAPSARSQGDSNQAGVAEPPVEQAIPVESVVRRKDVPTGEVGRLLTTGQMGGGAVAANCTLAAGGELLPSPYATDHGLGVDGCGLPAGGDLEVDLLDFPPGPLDVLVRRPDGLVKTTRIDTDPLDSWSRFVWVAYPGDPLGEYELVVTAGGSSTSGRFTVGVGINPLARVEPDWGPPGTTFKVYLGSYPPNSTAELFLYRNADADYVLWSDIGRISLNQRGEAVVNLPTLPDDDLAEYMLWTVPKIYAATANSAPKFQLSTSPELLDGGPADRPW
jgi:hypothetical protein